MNKFLASCMILMAALLGGCATGGGFGGGPAEPLKITNAGAFQGKRDVILGDFKVTFVTFDKEIATARGGMFSGNTGYAKSSMRAKLIGIDEAVFQQLTDAAYADFRAKLASSGYNVVDDSRMTGHPEYAKIKFRDGPYVNENSGLANAVTGGSREDITMAPSGRKLMKPHAFGGGAPHQLPYEISVIAKQTGTPIVSAHYTVHFANFVSQTSSSKNYTSGGYTNSAKVTMGQGLQVVWGSEVTLINGAENAFNKPNGKVMIVENVWSSAPFGHTENATSGMQKAASVVSGVLGAFSGGGGSIKEYHITAEPAQYSAAAQDVLSRANDRVIQKMASMR